MCVSRRGLETHITAKVVEDLNSWGRTSIVLKADGGPAIVQVMKDVQENRAHSTVPQNPPAYNPESNGAVERAVQECMCQLRAVKLQLEARIGAEMQVEWNVVHWMVEHSALLLNRFRVGQDGSSAYKRLMGKHSSKAIIEFGEQVLCRPMSDSRPRKRAEKFLEFQMVSRNIRWNLRQVS